MPRATRRQIRHNKIDAAERAQKLSLAAVPVNTGFAPTVPNPAFEVVRGLNSLSQANEAEQQRVTSERREQDVLDAKQDVLEGSPQQEERSETYVRAYSARSGAVAGVDVLSQIADLYEQNKNSGMPVESLEDMANQLVNQELKGQDDQDYSINLREKVAAGIPKLSRAYQDHSREVAQQTLIENITVDFASKLDEATSPEEIAGIYQGVFEDATTLHNLTPQETNKLLYNSIVQKAEAELDPSLIDALKFVETPQGNLLGIPKFARAAAYDIRRIGATKETLENKQKADQRRAIENRLFSDIAAGKGLDVGEVLNLHKNNLIGAGFVTLALRKLEEQKDKEQDFLDINKAFDAGLSDTLTKNERLEVLDSRIKADSTMEDVVQLSMLGNELPTMIAHTLKNTNFTDQEGWAKAQTIFKAYNTNPEASDLLANKIPKKRYVELDTYNFLTTFGRRTDEEAVNILLNRTPESKKQLIKEHEDEIVAGVAGVGKLNPQLQADAIRLAEEYVASGMNPEDAVDHTVSLIEKTHVEVRGLTLPRELAPHRNFEDSFKLWFDQGKFKEAVQGTNLAPVLKDTEFEDLQIGVDQQTLRDGTLTVKTDELSFHAITRIDPEEIHREHQESLNKEALEELQREREFRRQGIDSSFGNHYLPLENIPKIGFPTE